MQILGPQLRIALEIVPALVSTHQRHARYVEALLKQARYALVAQVMGLLLEDGA